MDKRLELKDFAVKPDSTLQEALETLNRNGYGIVVVVDEGGKMLGLLTDGDIRRVLLRGGTLNTRVGDVMNTDPIYVTGPVDQKKIIEIVSSKKFRERFRDADFVRIPVVDEEGRLIDIVSIEVHTRNYRSLAAAPPPPRRVSRVLVTGGGGYIGSVLVRKLLERGYRVVVLDSFLYSDIGLRDIMDHPRLRVIRGSITNVEDVINAVKDVDAIVHLAAVVGDPASRVNPRFTIETNYLATTLLAEAARYFGIQRFVFASTCSVYGASSEDKLLTEEDETNPLSLYAETKLRSEQSLLSLRTSLFHPTILRLGTVFGFSPRMRFDLVINLLTALAYYEKKIQIYGGDQWRPFVHVADVAEAVIVVLNAPVEKVSGEIFNVVGENIRIIELGEKIKKHVPEVEVVVRRDIKDPRNYRVSGEKIKRVLGWEPRISIEEGIKEILEHLRRGDIEHYRDIIYNNYKMLSKIFETDYE